MKLVLIFIVVMLMIGEDDTTISFSLFSNKLSGTKLIINAIIKLFFILYRLRSCLNIIIKIDSVRIISVVRISVGVIVSISTTWICTKDVGS